MGLAREDDCTDDDVLQQPFLGTVFSDGKGDEYRDNTARTTEKGDGLPGFQTHGGSVLAGSLLQVQNALGRAWMNSVE